jgi:valyl-tRNA synthetase
MEKLKQELEYTSGFLVSVRNKLSNERFVAGAPADVVERERKKMADAEARIKVIEKQMAGHEGQEIILQMYLNKQA